MSNKVSWTPSESSQMGINLETFILEGMLAVPGASGTFTTLLNQITLAAKLITGRVRRAGLANLLGYTGETNIQGEHVQKLDVIANDTLIEALRRRGHCAGVATEERGAIPVDGVSRTSVPTIYAAGDVTGRMMLASVAAMQGRNAMWHALGQAVAPLRWESVAACIFTDPEVATVGMTAEEAATAQMPVETISLPFTGNPRAKMGEWTDGFCKIHALEGSGTVLGCCLVAARASDLVHPLSVAVHNRLTVSQLAHAFSIYPSMSGSVQETARLLMGRLER
jgi:hypothetical protein